MSYRYNERCDSDIVEASPRLLRVDAAVEDRAGSFKDPHLGQGTIHMALPSTCGFGPEIQGDRTPGRS
jgi:hypothetical protein